ncbi:MAG: hypothetical protein Kow00107_04340 [Planctomycetota bacterium]
MNNTTRLAKPALLLALILLAGTAIGCGSAGGSFEIVINPYYDRYVTGYVYDDWDGRPIHGAAVFVENSYDGTLYKGYTDYDGYFEIWVGEYYDFEDVYFRVWRIEHPGYYSYLPDEYWYGVDDWWDIDTGCYILYPR